MQWLLKNAIKNNKKIKLNEPIGTNYDHVDYKLQCWSELVNSNESKYYYYYYIHTLFISWHE